MNLGGTLAAYADLERQAEDLITQDELCSTLRQERDECRSLLSLFRDQQLRKPRLWLVTGGVFLRTDKAMAFTRTMKTLEDTLVQLRKAESARTSLAQALLKHPGLATISSDPRIHRILSEVLEDSEDVE